MLQMTHPSPTPRMAARAARRARTRKRRVAGALVMPVAVVAVTAFFVLRTVAPAARSRTATSEPAEEIPPLLPVAAAGMGADMVLSHHPHVIEGIELYNGGLIAYSLGDSVFDHYSRKTGEAFILEASLGPSGVSDVLCTPVYLDSHGAPDFVTGTEAAVILERLRDISSPHGTTITIANDRAQVVR